MNPHNTTCKAIEDAGLKDDCVLNVAVGVADATICGIITDQAKRAECLAGVEEAIERMRSMAEGLGMNVTEGSPPA